MTIIEYELWHKHGEHIESQIVRRVMMLDRLVVMCNIYSQVRDEVFDNALGPVVEKFEKADLT